MSVGDVSIEFSEGVGGIFDWTLGELARDLPAVVHANGVTEIDHVVMLTPDLERSIAALEDQGIDLRRIREGETGMGTFRQAFFRLGRPVLEVVEAADMDDAAPRLLGDKLGRVKDAVQPGRRIATVRKEAGLGLPVALISAKS